MKVSGVHLKSRHWFIAKAVLLIFFWQITYHLVLEPHTNLDLWLTNLVAKGTIQFFHLVDREGSFMDGYLHVDGVRSVFIGNACNGLGLHALFIGFILITPGVYYVKILFSCLGVFLIYISNVVRVYLLGINFLANPNTFEFNHKYTYLWAVYFIVFVLWMVWLEIINKKHFAKS